MLAIDVEWLEPVYEAALDDAGEWPPHPGRLFFALVAAADLAVPTTWHWSDWSSNIRLRFTPQTRPSPPPRRRSSPPTPSSATPSPTASPAPAGNAAGTATTCRTRACASPGPKPTPTPPPSSAWPRCPDECPTSAVRPARRSSASARRTPPWTTWSAGPRGRQVRGDCGSPTPVNSMPSGPPTTPVTTLGPPAAGRSTAPDEEKADRPAPHTGPGDGRAPAATGCRAPRPTGTGGCPPVPS